jgi:hypothetical protein
MCPGVGPGASMLGGGQEEGCRHYRAQQQTAAAHAHTCSLQRSSSCRQGLSLAPPTAMRMAPGSQCVQVVVASWWRGGEAGRQAGVGRSHRTLAHPAAAWRRTRPKGACWSVCRSPGSPSCYCQGGGRSWDGEVVERSCRRTRLTPGPGPRHVEWPLVCCLKDLAAYATVDNCYLDTNVSRIGQQQHD